MLVLLIAFEAPQIASGRTNGADRIVCDPLDPKSCSTPLKDGEAAPYAGQLLTPKLAITLGQKAQWCDQRWQLKLDREVGLLQVELDKERQLRKIDVESYQAQIKLYQKSLESGIPFYREPWFVATVAIVGTVAAMSAAIKGASLLR